MRVAVGGGEGRDVDGIPDGLVAGRVDHIPQGLFGVLNATTLRVSVPEEDQLLLLPRPEAPDAFLIHLQRKRPTSPSALRLRNTKEPPSHLDDAEAEVAPVEHDDFVLVGPFVQHVAQGEERRGVGQHGAPPGGVAFVSDHQVLLVGGDGFEEDRRLVVLVRGGEVVLSGRRESSDWDADSEVERQRGCEASPGGV